MVVNVKINFNTVLQNFVESNINKNRKFLLNFHTSNSYLVEQRKNVKNH